ncbi:CDP-diacylglycerol--inositol 3-phosphatidyltransferase [Eudromia elegans]
MAAEENVFLFVPNVIGYLRLLLLAAAFALMAAHPGPAAAAYGLAGLLDALDGHAARLLRQGTRFGALLDMLTDRVAALGLLLHLALLYPGAAPLFQLLSALDVASHWLHVHSSVLQGAESHKSVGAGGNRLLRLYYESRPLLFLLCAGNEGFYCSLYLVHHGEGPPVFPGGPGLFRLLLFLSAPAAMAKAALHLLQLLEAARAVAALDREERRRRR